ncbi:MAG: bifunctional phosphopantothenoylcysteine decarboxylase/phosphopantothenate--cysteine ligase CoaBC [Bacteroidota bacterium]|jgi:phosphopantothenoylcysteine decarboxylase/phosphopantothenate--cysteine ligase
MQGKRILLGITGGIAAYKIAFLVRILIKSGAEVKCIMTPASSDFISPLVLATLSGNPVGIEFWNKDTGVWANHVEYGLWADLFVVAPLTANSLAKMANGSCDNLVLATYLSMKAPVMVAPAMDLDMYAHPSTKRNITQLEKDGVVIIPAERGELASGLEGEGRMAEPETIAIAIQNHFSTQFPEKSLSGKKVLITAGPTYEALDPVRFIGNHSSGKMGFALAESCLTQGADVTIICGPTALGLKHENLKTIHVKTAAEMLGSVQAVWNKMDIGIFAAAVADYRPKNVVNEKIKKNDDSLVIEFVKNPDILAWAGSVKKDIQILVGFALETNNMLANGKSKLEKKNLDLIVMNNLSDQGAGFAGDTNKISILDNHNNLTNFELKSKSEVAKDIVEYLINLKK